MSEKRNTHHLHIELTPEQYQLLTGNARQCGLSKRAFIIPYLIGGVNGHLGRDFPPMGGIGVRGCSPASAQMYICAMLAEPSPPGAAMASAPPSVGLRSKW